MLLSCLWILTACNSEDLSYDIEYTPIHPLGGQYTVSVSRNGAVVAEHVDCFLANTSDYDTDKCWIRIGTFPPLRTETAGWDQAEDSSRSSAQRLFSGASKGIVPARKPC